MAPFIPRSCTHKHNKHDKSTAEGVLKREQELWDVYLTCTHTTSISR